MAHGQRKILVIDDDQNVRESLGVLLEARGYRVDTAADGKEALDKLRSGPPACLLILDLKMPNMDGRALLGELSRDRVLAGVPVLLVSGEVDLPAIATAIGTEHLSKPVDLKELFHFLERHCPSNAEAAHNCGCRNRKDHAS